MADKIIQIILLKKKTEDLQYASCTLYVLSDIGSREESNRMVSPPPMVHLITVQASKCSSSGFLISFHSPFDLTDAIFTSRMFADSESFNFLFTELHSHRCTRTLVAVHAIDRNNVIILRTDDWPTITVRIFMFHVHVYINTYYLSANMQ